MELDGDLIALLTNPDATYQSVQKYLNEKTDAEKYYEKVKAASKRYYEAHKEEITKKRREDYRIANPEVKKRGRKPKVAADPSS